MKASANVSHHVAHCHDYAVRSIKERCAANGEAFLERVANEKETCSLQKSLKEALVLFQVLVSSGTVF